MVGQNSRAQLLLSLLLARVGSVADALDGKKGAARVLLGTDALTLAEEASRQFGERVAVSLGVGAETIGASLGHLGDSLLC